MKSKRAIFGLVLLFTIAAFGLERDWAARAGEAQPPLQTGHPKSIGNHVQFSVGNRNVKALFLDGKEAWIGTSSGLVRYNAGTSSHRMYTNKSGLLSNGVFYVGKVRGEIWVGTYGGGLSVLDSETGVWRNYNIPQGMADAFVYDVLETSAGDIWIATWSGANLIKDGEIDRIENWLLYTVENTSGGLPNDWVYGMAEGRNGTIWMATEGGLARFVDGEWTNWQHEDGLGAPYDLVESDMPFRNDPGEVSGHHARQKKEQGLEDVAVAYNPNYIVSLEVDDNGNVWAGTWGGGLSRFDGKTWTTFTVRDGLPGNHIFSLGRDRDGMLWVGTSRGLAAFDGNKFATFSVHDGLVSNTVFSIAAAEDGNMWVGAFGGATWFPRGLGN